MHFCKITANTAFITDFVKYYTTKEKYVETNKYFTNEFRLLPSNTTEPLNEISQSQLFLSLMRYH